MSLNITDIEKAHYFRVFVFNEHNLIMMEQKKNYRLDLPDGQIAREDMDLETAIRRIVFKKTKTALGAIAPVAFIQSKNRQQQAIPTAIFVARTDSDAQIKEDEKTWHRFIEERNLLSQPGYNNELTRTLLEAAKDSLFREEVRIEHEEETQYGQEKYNLRSQL